ncbi:MAG: hypothetical protein ACRD2N_20805 [Vicinamibacterales bacterium]
MTRLHTRPIVSVLLLGTLGVAAGSPDVLAQVAAVPAAKSIGSAEDNSIDVQTELSQTALWVGNVVTYAVTLSCRPNVDVLQEDLGADKLTLDGLQVVGHTVQRRVASDGRTLYEIAYRLTTYEPGVETLAIEDWTVRYAVGVSGQRAGSPAHELHIPGAVVAWRSALPAAIKTLDLREGRAVEAVPEWWRWTRPIGLGLVVVSAVAVGWLVLMHLSAGRPAKPKRRVNRESARELVSAIGALRETDVSTSAARLAAYSTIEATIRRHAAGVTNLPASALTPAELRDRLATSSAPSAEAIVMTLSECERVRYQPVDRLPGVDHFHTTLEGASQLLTGTR